jgi:hypothetical protein
MPSETPTRRSLFRIVVGEVQRHRSAFPLMVGTVWALRPWMTPEHPGSEWINAFFQLAAAYLWLELLVRIFRSWRDQRDRKNQKTWRR